METKSIYERAKALQDTLPCDEPKSLVYDAYVKGAIYQDSISRAEERERCIKKACEWLTDNLYAFVSYDENDGIGLKIDYTQLTKMLRKAMEE